MAVAARAGRLARERRSGCPCRRLAHSQAVLVAEIDDEIDSAPFHAAGERAVGGRLAFGNRSLQAQEVGELVFELELARVARAEQLAELQEQPLADLLADGDRRALALVARRIEL